MRPLLDYVMLFVLFIASRWVADGIVALVHALVSRWVR